VEEEKTKKEQKADAETKNDTYRAGDRGPLNLIANDVMIKKPADVKIEETEQSLRAILSASPIGICRLSKERVFYWVNDAMCRITGYSLEEFSGQNSRFLFENDEDYEKGGASLRTKDWYETKHRKKDGSIIDVFLQFTPIDESSYIATVTDITDRKNTEREQAKMGKLESLGVLAGGIAHDFNNILTMILGNVSLAKMYMGQNQERAHEKLTSAEQAIMRAKDLTQQLLTFSKGGVPIKKVLTIDDILNNVCNLVLIGTPVVCTLDFAPDLLPVEVDETQITQAVGHIIINGHEAMREGGTITIRAENAVIDTPMDNIQVGRYIKISITDQGVGIPEEYLGSIFDPYFTTKQKGSGLGLAVSYSIIKNHNGHIAVESTLGVGTVFHIYLPVFEGCQRSVRKTTDNIAQLSGARVLVMDDEDSIRDIVGDILNFHGYEVDFAINGEEAISLYQKNIYGAVILDLTIPGGMGGKETIKELLRIDPHVRAIVSSGYSSDPIMSDYQQYGFKDVMAKPYKLEELGEVVRKVIAED
jgi:PAS domain S-box-containing protein